MEKKNEPREVMENAPAPVMNVKQAASYLRLSTSTIYFLKKNKKIPFLKIGGALRFRREEIDKWLANKSYTAIN